MLHYIGAMGFSNITGLLIFSVYAFPVLGGVVLLIAGFLLMRGWTWNKALLRALVDTLAVASLIPAVLLTLVMPGGVHTTIELVPLTDMWATGINATTLYQNAGNVLLFLPFGALLPVAFNGVFARLWRILAVAAGLAVAIEVLQYLLDVGRVSSTDDVILNTAGAALGCVLTQHWWRRPAAESHRSPADATRSTPAQR